MRKNTSVPAANMCLASKLTLNSFTPFLNLQCAHHPKNATLTNSLACQMVVSSLSICEQVFELVFQKGLID